MILPRQVGEAVSMIVARQYYNSRTCRYNRRYCTSAWNRYGRWILAGVLIFIFLILIFLILCVRQRRMRRARNNMIATPMASHPGYGNNNPQYQYGNNTGYNQQYAAPPGPPPPTYGNENAGYYGQQQYGFK
ncbi:hypothetical protein B0O99DRAFT_50295 [Bisporella sp. PMI_857]|nr:hypothetical protein B0O99DRAFT_50295 [Bisporella sp. PMI_857]